MKPALQKLKRVAIYGGAFDPPHKGHLGIIHELTNMDMVDEVWVLPSGQRKDKQLLLGVQQRANLLQQLTDSICKKKVSVCFEEIDLSESKNQDIPTSQLFSHLHSKYTGYQFYFVVGGDILNTINTWENYLSLLQTVKFIIFPRKGHSLNEQLLPQSYVLSPFLPQEVSSSFLKGTLLDSLLTKEQKLKVVEDWVDHQTVKVLRQMDYL